MTHSNLPAIIGPGNTYIPLLAVQQRPHSRVYQMPVREHGSAAEATAASSAARARLRQPLPAMVALKRVFTPPTPEPEIVSDTAPLNMLTDCSWKFLVALVALRNGLTPDDVTGRSRKDLICAARHEAIYMVALHTVYDTGRIGRLFGGRDHTTILNSLSKFPQILREGILPYMALPLGEPVPNPSREERGRIIEHGYANGWSCKDMARAIGQSESAVKGYALKHGLRHPAKPYYTRKSMTEAQNAAS